MEAPEYAKKLFNKFKSIKIIFIETESGQTKEASSVVTDELAKQCALIAVDEIIEATKIKQSKWEDRHKTNCEYEIIYSKYWQKVKTEIENL